MPPSFPSRPTDATLSVTKAARLLGVHPNTIRTWSDAGRLRYFRINSRGDRRYRLGDLQRFLASAAPQTAVVGPSAHAGSARRSANPGAAESLAVAARQRTGDVDPLGAERRRLDLSVTTALARLAGHAHDGVDPFEDGRRHHPRHLRAPPRLDLGAPRGTVEPDRRRRGVRYGRAAPDRPAANLRDPGGGTRRGCRRRRRRTRRWRAAGDRPGVGDAAGRPGRPARAGHRDPGTGRPMGRPADRR